MVDRIQKPSDTEYLRVEASAESEDRGGQDEEEQEEESSTDEFSSFHEKTDWQVLFDKSKLWKKNIALSQDEIEQVIFRKVNLKTDPSLLRVDIVLSDGEVIAPAFMAISRMQGLQVKSIPSGQEIPLNKIFVGHTINITIPTNPELFQEKTPSAIKTSTKKTPSPSPTPPQTPAKNLDDTDDTVTESTLTSLNPRLNWKDILKPVDPENQKIRLEIVSIYALIAVLLTLIVFAGFHLI